QYRNRLGAILLLAPILVHLANGPRHSWATTQEPLAAPGSKAANGLALSRCDQPPRSADTGGSRRPIASRACFTTP
ncbi:hypothetical protein, partial [Burkholderia glumae]|uniref:hypothetical protein n=1 Tax=Burkholderia glumae TaxID=337 RepID=UPI001E611363